MSGQGGVVRALPSLWRKHILVNRPWLLKSQDQLWIDYEQSSCHLVKEIEPTCSCFQGHFPNNPIFPGVLLLELQFQTAAIYALHISEQQQQQQQQLFYSDVPTLKTCRFRQLVKPLDKLDIVGKALDSKTNSESLNHPQTRWNFQATISRHSKIVAESSFVVTIVPQDSLPRTQEYRARTL